MAQAEAYYTRAAEMGDPDALYELGVFSQERGESAAAVANFQAALERAPDHVSAYLELARHYVNGAGIEKDEKKAFEMMKNVADTSGGEYAVVAQMNVGVFYLMGVGVEASREQAERYLSQAAEAGATEAQAILDRLGDRDQGEQLEP